MPAIARLDSGIFARTATRVFPRSEVGLRAGFDGVKAEAHKKSDQVLFMLRGKLTGKVDQEKILKKGDVLLILAGDASPVCKQGQETGSDA
jgi:hypothetical protein